MDTFYHKIRKVSSEILLFCKNYSSSARISVEGIGLFGFCATSFKQIGKNAPPLGQSFSQSFITVLSYKHFRTTFRCRTPSMISSDIILDGSIGKKIQFGLHFTVCLSFEVFFFLLIFTPHVLLQDFVQGRHDFIYNSEINLFFGIQKPFGLFPFAIQFLRNFRSRQLPFLALFQHFRIMFTV